MHEVPVRTTTDEPAETNQAPVEAADSNEDKPNNVKKFHK